MEILFKYLSVTKKLHKTELYFAEQCTFKDGSTGGDNGISDGKGSHHAMLDYLYLKIVQKRKTVLLFQYHHSLHEIDGIIAYSSTFLQGIFPENTNYTLQITSYELIQTTFSFQG